jgi:phage tail sheath gpL-like
MSGTNVAPQAVSFSAIPPNLRVPLFSAEINNSQTNANQQAQRVLLIGGTLNAVPLVPVFMPPPSGSGATGAMQAAAAQFGFGSMLSMMVGKYRLNDGFTEMWVLPMPDPSGGAAATGQLVFSGTATAAGTLNIYVGDVLTQVGVTAGQAAASVASAVSAALAAANLPVTSAVTTGTVTLTTKHKCVEMNALNLSLNDGGAQAGQYTPAGLTVSVTGFSGATGTVVWTNVVAALGTLDFDFIITSYNDSVAQSALTALMSDSGGRWNWQNQQFGGIWAADVDIATNLLTFGAALNDQHTVTWGVTGTHTTPWEVAAAATGACVPSIIAQPNLPLQTRIVLGIAPPVSPGVIPSKSTLNSLLTTGIAALTFDRTGVCRVVRAVTTYQTNGFGVADQSYLDVGTLYTLAAIVRRLKGMVTQRYSNVLLVDDGTLVGAGIPAVSPKIIRNDLIMEYAIMEDIGLTENTAAFAAGLIVVRNQSDPTRVDVLFDPHVVTGLAIFAVATQFHLGG